MRSRWSLVVRRWQLHSVILSEASFPRSLLHSVILSEALFPLGGNIAKSKDLAFRVRYLRRHKKF